jgi:hypothetical protein
LASDWRLSYSFLPFASASSTFTLPSLKYMDSGTSDSPPSRVLPIRRSISFRCNSSLRVRRGVWLVHVPSTYSGMCRFRSHTSPSSTVANASTSDARPRRSDLTSVPIRAIPASYVSMIE